MEMMMILWFVLLSGSAGYIEPMYVTPASCGLPVTVASLQADREVNPRVARWADCSVDVRERVAGLPDGVYEFAATGIGYYVPPDPHTSDMFVVSPDFEEQPQVAPTDNFEYQVPAPDLATAQGYRHELELDATLQAAALAHSCTGAASPFTCRSPIPAITPTQHTARVRMVNVLTTGSRVEGLWSSLLTFTMSAVPGTPVNLRIVGVPPVSPED